jgi:hypothetical protein
MEVLVRKNPILMKKDDLRYIFFLEIYYTHNFKKQSFCRGES